jgi:hypothetical protein
VFSQKKTGEQSPPAFSEKPTHVIFLLSFHNLSEFFRKVEAGSFISTALFRVTSFPAVSF